MNRFLFAQKLDRKYQKLARFHERMTAVNVTVDLERADEPIVEVRVSVERTKDFVSRTTGGSLMGAVDGAARKLEEQLRRHKDKIVEHRVAGRRTEVPPRDNEVIEGEE